MKKEMEAATMATINERALVARINRRMTKLHGERIRRCAYGSRWASELGRYFSTDIRSGFVKGKHYDIESLGRELGVLKNLESLQG